MMLGILIPWPRTISAHIGCSRHRVTPRPGGLFPNCGPVHTFRAVMWLGRPFRIRRLA